MSAPVGSLKDLQELLEGRGGYVFEQRSFPFYSVLMYAPQNGLNKLLHEYVKSHYELFNSQTGPNWLVAVVEDIGREEFIDTFRPQDVYNIARYLGARVDEIPAIVFFVDPKDHDETLVLRLSDILPPATQVTDEDLTRLIGTIAAAIDEISNARLPPAVRLARLEKALNAAWSKDSVRAPQLSSAVDWLRTSAATATTVLVAIKEVLKLVKAVGSP
jgi:hypothetical protein